MPTEDRSPDATASLDDPSSLLIEAYDADTHHAGIEEICKNVYGGTDYLPALIQKWKEEGDHLLVACGRLPAPASPPSADSTVLAVGGARGHGDTFWIYGLRTHEAARGRGLATQILKVLQRRLHDPARPAQLLSATIAINTPMRRVFRRLGWAETHRLFVFPPWERTRALDAANGGSRTDASTATLASFYPPAAALATDLPTPEAVGSYSWSVAENVEAVVSAMERILGLEAGTGTDRELFFPFEYKVYPVRSAQGAAMAAEGRVQVLREGPEGRPVALYAHAVSEEMQGRMCVGVVARGGPEATFCLQRIVREVPRPVTFLYLRDASPIGTGREDRTRVEFPMFDPFHTPELGPMDEYMLVALP